MGYLYSVWNMYDNSTDECRTMYLQLSRAERLPVRFVGLAMLGEFINTFCGFAMTVTLFTVFCLSLDPFNLVINCIAINFLGTVDNEFMDDDLKKGALHDLRLIFDTTNNGTLVPPELSCEQSFLYGTVRCIQFFLAFTRKVGTLGIGHILGFVFPGPQLCT